MERSSDNKRNSKDEEVIYLKVNCLNVHRSLDFKIKSAEKIGDIKLLFCQDLHTTATSRELYFNGKRLEDHKRVVDCGIRNGSYLHLIVKDLAGLKLLVVIPSLGKTIPVRVMTYHPIKFVKDRIHRLEGFSDEYKLYYAGRQLDEDRRISALGIQDGSILHLIFDPIPKLSVFVVLPNGERVSLEVQLLHSVSDVKAIVSSLRGMPVDDYNLVYNGLQLHDSKTLAYYEIEDRSMMWLSSQQFQIFFKAGSCNTLILDVDRSDTIQDVHTKILQKLGISSGACSLITYFSGKLLEGDHDIAYYNIQKDSTINAVLRPK